MALRPWSKFYWSDWRADPRLRMCSLAARGLWVELCGLAHEAEPYGHVLVAGRVPSPEQLASLVGAPLKAVLAALKELDAAEVFSRTDAGVIYSRRMVRDREREEKDKANGKGGGNPYLKAKDNGGVNPHDKPPDKAQKLDTRIQNPESEREDTPRDAIADEFDGQFWPAYPLRKAKGAALKAYRSARKRTTLTVILTALDKQRSVFAEPKYSPHATTWLNGDRWLDEIIEGAGNGPKPTKFDNMLAGVLAAAGGGDAGETVEPLPAGSQITGSLENADGRLLGPPEPVSGHRH